MGVSVSQNLTYDSNSKDSVNNTIKVTYTVKCTTSGDSYNSNSQTGTFYIDGTKYTNSYKLPKSTTTTVFNKTVTISNASDKKISASYSFPTTPYYGTQTGNKSLTLPNIPRYAYFSSQPSVTNKSTSSLDIFYKPDRTITSVQYSLNGGSWTDITTVSGTWNSTSGATFRISGLTANTTYKVQVRIQAYNSGLWTYSNTISGTTHAKTVPTISLSSKTVNSITVTSGCNVTVSSTQYRIKASNGNYGSYQNSATFTGLSPNTTYLIEVKKVGTASGETGYATITVATYSFATISASNFNLGDSFNINISNPSGQSIEFFAETLINGQRENTVRVTSISAGTHKITFSDNELDMIYKKMGTGNSTLIRIGVRTIGTYYDWKDVTCTLTGNQKTAHLGVNNVQKRAKVFVGVNSSVKRAVLWIGNNGRKRCI